MLGYLFVLYRASHSAHIQSNVRRMTPRQRMPIRRDRNLRALLPMCIRDAVAWEFSKFTDR
jgi:hypothetical protein